MFHYLSGGKSIGRALFGVNFRPLQEIEAIMEGGRIFDTKPFFAILQYLRVSYLDMITCFSVSSHLLFHVITSTQKVSYHVRTIASDVIPAPIYFK